MLKPRKASRVVVIGRGRHWYCSSLTRMILLTVSLLLYATMMVETEESQNIAYVSNRSMRALRTAEAVAFSPTYSIDTRI